MESTDTRVNRILGGTADQKVKESIKISDGNVRMMTHRMTALDQPKDLQTSTSPLARTQY
jgi:hypothetical protein